MRKFALAAIATALPLMACSEVDSLFHRQSQSQAQTQQPSQQTASNQHYGNQQYGRMSDQQSSQAFNQDQVRQVQQALDSKGYNPGPTDGRLGPQTRSALNQFQQKQGLPQTGTPDNQTLAALGVAQNNAQSQR